MQIERRTFDAAVVLDLNGNFTGEHAGLLKDHIDALAAKGEKKLVLNLAGVPYIDSSGLGEIVYAYTTMQKRGGKLVLCALTKRVENFLSGLTNLISIFDVGNTIDDALRLFEPSDFEVSCPVCPTDSWVTLLNTSGSYPSLTCPTCLTRYSVRADADSLKAAGSDKGADRPIPVAELDLRTYEGERIHVSSGPPVQIQIVGRLDLFASEVVEKAWRLIPAPRRVVFPMGYYTTEFTDKGLARVLDLCRWTDNDRAVVQIDYQLSAELKGALPSDRRVHASAELAAEALGSVEHPSSISVRIRRSRTG